MVTKCNIFTVYRKIKNKFIESFIKQHRLKTLRRQSILFPKNKQTMREIVKKIKDHHFCTYIDQRTNKHDVYLEFLRQKTNNIDMLPIKLALKNNLPIICAYPQRSNGFSVKYKIIYHEITYNKNSLSADQDSIQSLITQQILDYFTKVIDKEPHIWFWMHDLWK